ncbi:MAG: hypothetical protein WAW85_01865 [Gordonia sp. (in: high G+C Gram-positive bacteria)]
MDMPFAAAFVGSNDDRIRRSFRVKPIDPSLRITLAECQGSVSFYNSITMLPPSVVGQGFSHRRKASQRISHVAAVEATVLITSNATNLFDLSPLARANDNYPVTPLRYAVIFSVQSKHRQLVAQVRRWILEQFANRMEDVAAVDREESVYIFEYK